MRFATLLLTIPLSLVSIGFAVLPAATHGGTTSRPADENVSSPELVSKVAPEYPPEAREAELEGNTVLQATIDQDGRVDPETIRCLRCSVRRRGEDPEEVLHGWCDDFCDASAEAVAKWRYKPGMKDGEPVDVYFTIVIQFKLDGEDP